MRPSAFEAKSESLPRIVVIRDLGRRHAHWKYFKTSARDNLRMQLNSLVTQHWKRYAEPQVKWILDYNRDSIS